MIELKLFIAVVAVAVVTIALLYKSPFARCRGCPGRRCRRCRGLGRYQRRGSRTVHRAAASVRKEIERTRAERQDAADRNPTL